MFKAVLFDLFETLVTESGTAVPRASAVGETLGLDGRAFRAEWKQRRPLVLRGQLSFRQALEEIGTRLGLAIPDDRLQEVCDERVRAKAIVFRKIDPELISLTRDLCQQGVRLATVSNCIAEDVDSWAGCALAPQFGCAVFSFAVGAVKPDPGIYLEATRRLDVDPADTLYIGDGADDELTGAVGAGLRAAQAAWFVSQGASITVPRLFSPHDVLRLVAAG